MEYVNVTGSEFRDILSVFQERSQNFRYSIEDSGDGPLAEICEKYDEGEYHIHGNLDEIEDILWAIQVVDGPELTFQGVAVGSYVAVVQD